MGKKQKNNLANFLFEAASLKRLQRTGWQILGDNRESIAEHTFMVCVISFSLAQKLEINIEKVLLMALFHDFAETRTGDIYKLADLYVKADEEKAIADVFVNLPNSGKITNILEEYEEEKTLESKLVHDADTLGLCIELKQLIENGNINAEEWFDANIKSMRLKQSKKLAEELIKTNSQNWWMRQRRLLHRSLKR